MNEKSQTQVLKDYRTRRRQRMFYVMGGCCQVCGYNKCLATLEFHHLDPTIKEYGLSTSWSISWAKTKEELKKCILLCANCHREVHAGALDVSNLQSPFDQEKADEITQTIKEIKQHQR